MRTISAAMDALLSTGNVSEHVRVKVHDAAGAYQDLTSYPGFDALETVRWEENIDGPHRTADIVLKREMERFSIAPLMVASAANTGFVPGGTYAPLIALNRKIKIEVAIVSMDKQPISGDWFNVFEGYIDSVDAASGEFLGISAIDLGSAVMDRFIKTERVHSYGEVAGLAVGMRVYEPSMTLAVNEYVLPATRGTADSGNGKFYKVTSITTGITATTEPTWPGAGTVVSGGVTFTYQGTTSAAGNPVEEIMQNILDNNLGGVTLDVPVSPSWNIKQFIQRREPTLTALRELALQIGWEVRYVWKAAASAFVLRLYEPDRTKATVDRTFTARDYEDLTRLSIEKGGIRNVVRVIYSDAADLHPDGTPKRKTIEVTDATSVAAYGEMFMEIAEDSNSQIDTSTEAARMANAALADLKDPKGDAAVNMAQGFPWVELGDRYTFSANHRHFSGAQTLSVYAYQHTARNGVIETTMQLRGQPALGYDKWQEIEAHPSVKPNHMLTQLQSATGATASLVPTVGGARLQMSTTPDKNAHVEEYEHHVSTSSSFTPSSSTLVGTTKSREMEINNLTPGTTYYHRSVVRTRNAERIIRGEPSVTTSFVAGRAAAGHIESAISLGAAPLNGGFETYFAGAGLPDQWSGDASAVTVKSDSSGNSGARYIRLTAAAASKAIYSAWMTCKASTYYRIDSMIKGSAGTDAFTIEWQGADYAQTPDVGTNIVHSFNSSNFPTWTNKSAYLVTGSTTRFLRVVITCATGSNYVDFDELRFEEVRPFEQIVFTGDALDTGGTTRFALPGYFGGGGVSATEVKARTIVGGVLSSMDVSVRTASTNVSYVVTVRVGGVDTALTATFGSGSTGQTDLTHFVVIDLLQQLSVKVVSSATGGSPVAADDLVVTFLLSR